MTSAACTLGRTYYDHDRTLELPIPEWVFVVLIDTGLPGVLLVLAIGQV